MTESTPSFPTIAGVVYYPVGLQKAMSSCRLSGVQTNLMCRSKEDGQLYPIAPSALMQHYRAARVSQEQFETLRALVIEAVNTLELVETAFDLTPPTANPPERSRTAETVQDIQRSLKEFPPKYAIGQEVQVQVMATLPVEVGVVMGLSCDEKQVDSWSYLVAIIDAEGEVDESLWVDPEHLELSAVDQQTLDSYIEQQSDFPPIDITLRSFEP